MLQLLEQQIETERLYNKRIQNSLCIEDLKTLDEYDMWSNMAVELFKPYINGTYYDSKNKRLEQLTEAPEVLWEYVLLSVVSTVPGGTELPYVSVAGKLASKLSMSNKSMRAALHTAGELLAIWSDIGAYKVWQKTKGSRVYILCSIELEDDINILINSTQYLPPMCVQPNLVTKNDDSGYLTIKKDSLILGDKENYHENDICLDVINILNTNEYVINSWFKDNYQEPQTIEEDLFHQWYLMEKDNIANTSLYFNHKYDKRGRIYASGYHYNPLGTEYHKAELELKNKEVIV